MTNFKIKIIASNAKENCIILYSNESSLVLDLGVSKSHYDNFLIHEGINNVDGILVSHEHIDHIRGIKDQKNVYTTKLTKQAIGLNSIMEIEKNKWFKIKNWKIKAIKSIHNAIDPVVLIIKSKGIKVVYFTDSEYFENKNFKGATHFLVEANYDNQYEIKDSQVGKHKTKVENHLTLASAESFVRKYKSRKTSYVKFIHLSSSTINTQLIEKIESDLLK